jgi:hypothetical protein
MGPGRFELPTSRLSGVRSNQLSYEPVIKILSKTPISAYSLKSALAVGFITINIKKSNKKTAA